MKSNLFITLSIVKFGCTMNYEVINNNTNNTKQIYCTLQSCTSHLLIHLPLNLANIATHFDLKLPLLDLTHRDLDLTK